MLTTSESEARDWKMDPWISATSFAPPNLLFSFLSLFSLSFLSHFRWRCVFDSITFLAVVTPEYRHLEKCAVHGATTSNVVNYGINYKKEYYSTLNNVVDV